MSVRFATAFLCLLFGIGANGQNAFGEVVFQEALRWNFTHMNPSCTGPDGGRNPCKDIRICSFAVASLAMGGWPTLCGWVGKGVPKVCCGLPLVLGDVLMKKDAEERSRNRDCGTIVYPAETEITKRFFQIKNSLPEVNIEDPNKFDPPLDLEIEPMLIPPPVYSGSRQGHFPWMVSVRQNGSHLCGGSLIDRKHILTAASCVDNNNNNQYTVHVGNLYVDDGYAFNTSKIDFHPQYDKLRNYKNLAVITLSEEILHPNIAHVCLLGSDSSGINMEGMSGTLLQWGKKDENGDKKQYLNVIDDLIIVPTENCLKNYEMCSNDLTPKELDKDFICTETVSENPVKFQDDIGGPLLCKNSLAHDSDAPWTAVAVDTFGFKCGNARFSRLLTKVSSHMNWIEEIMNE